MADRIVLEVGDLGRHEAVDPSFGSDDVGEEAGPVAVAWVDVDDGGARIDAANRINSDSLDWSYIGNLRYGWAFDRREACEVEIRG